MKIPIGKISGCEEGSKICGYRCCDQDMPVEGTPIRPEDYILMYPGEYNPEDERQKHLNPVAEFAGGVLARCNKECFDQSQCDPSVNYKPLDCRTYPLTPQVVDGELCITKDVRCPLDNDSLGTTLRELALAEWQSVVDADPAAMSWLSELKLQGYK